MQIITLALAAISIASVSAAPSTVVRSDPKILTSAISAVSGTRSAVDTQVTIISMPLYHLYVSDVSQSNSSTENLVQTTVSNAVAPALQASLKNIAGEITSVSSFVNPLVIDVALPLAQAELENLPGFVADVQDIVEDVQDVANVILAGLSQRTLRSAFQFIIMRL
jgi:hypothetical protein